MKGTYVTVKSLGSYATFWELPKEEAKGWSGSYDRGVLPVTEVSPQNLVGGCRIGYLCHRHEKKRRGDW